MRVKVFPWLGQEFVSLSWEGNGLGSLEDEMRELFGRFSDWLGRFGMTLDNTVRTRMFVRDVDTWYAAGPERAKFVSGGARSASSSHVRPDRLGDDARLAIDLLAMQAPKTGEQKILREYEPQTRVLRRLTWGKLVFCSGVTDMTHPTLDEQLPVIIGNLTGTLQDAGVSWERVERASFFLHRDESIPKLRAYLDRAVDLRRAAKDFTFVDTRQGKRLEIELTATLA
jgi:enamine deaminase RidA (YjgF/YER057c/UK114 family)